jgi:hypothetical protein
MLIMPRALPVDVGKCCFSEIDAIVLDAVHWGTDLILGGTNVMFLLIRM